MRRCFAMPRRRSARTSRTSARTCRIFASLTILQHTARMLGRLYDGIECQGIAPELVELVGREAGVPVYDGLASDRHPTARLAALLGGTESPGTLRQLVLQTVLLSTLA